MYINSFVRTTEEILVLEKRAVYKGATLHTYSKFVPKKDKVDIANFKIKIFGQRIKPEHGKTVRVLGINWDTCLDFGYHLHVLFKRGVKRMAIIHRLSRQDGLAEVELLHIVNSWLVTSLMYAADIWDLAPPQKKQKIDSLIVSAYRKVLGVHNKASTAKVLHELGEISPADQRLLQALRTHLATERDPRENHSEIFENHQRFKNSAINRQNLLQPEHYYPQFVWRSEYARSVFAKGKALMKFFGFDELERFNRRFDVTETSLDGRVPFQEGYMDKDANWGGASTRRLEQRLCAITDHEHFLNDNRLAGHTLLAYTDGSFCPDTHAMGGGIVLYWGKDLIFSGGFPLGVGENPKHAELGAVHRLLENLLSLLDSTKEILVDEVDFNTRTVLNIYIDSKGAIETILNYRKGVRSKNQLLVMLDMKLHSLFTNHNIIVIVNQVASHAGIPGNTLADKHAGKGLTTSRLKISNHGPEPILRVENKSLVKLAIDQLRFLRGTKFAQKYQTDQAWLSKTYFGQRIMRSRYRITIPQILTAMRLGCSKLNVDRYKYNVTWQKRLSKGWCYCSSFFEKYEETSKHFLFECGRYSKQRQILMSKLEEILGRQPKWGDIMNENPEIKPVQYREIYIALAKFFNATGRFGFNSGKFDPDLAIDGHEESKSG